MHRCISIHQYTNRHIKRIVSRGIGRVFVAQIRDVARGDAVHGGVLQEPSVRSGHRPGSRGKRRCRRAHQACWCGRTHSCLAVKVKAWLAIVRGVVTHRTAAYDRMWRSGSTHTENFVGMQWRGSVTTVEVSPAHSVGVGSKYVQGQEERDPLFVTSNQV